MCGRCRKTCPWNLEELFAELPFRWAARNLPGSAPLLAKPAARSKYQIAVLYIDIGRGGSKLMHRIFEEGWMVFNSKPINHFALIEDAANSYLIRRDASPAGLG